MGKNKKPTPQELYWARKRREEEERNANLPPGLINHGNTCFMNSTLQGLIATPLLHQLVNFDQIAPLPDSHIAARRSPQLTNGHGLAGSYEHEWVQGMPLGDVFVALMKKCWGIQESHTRESMSPKELLTTIGRKYDQYLDFRQQDAHEFLRHMLDAMRMEELDIIKKRQPPPPSIRKHRSAKVTPNIEINGAEPSAPSSSHSSKGEEKLESFVDMLFGGKLASILVCDACKKVSITYEDFNDLSLSIKPEDYTKERKRERLKLLAKKLRGLRPRESDESAIPMQRSSSVPASPVRRSLDPVPHDPDPPVIIDHRRRSFDHVEESNKSGDELGNEVKEGSEEAKAEETVSLAPSSANTPGEQHQTGEEAHIHHVSFAQPTNDGDQKKEKEDGWGKLGRRISMRMGIQSKSEKRLSRSKYLASEPASRATSRERASNNPMRPHLGTTDSSSDIGRASDVASSRVATPSPASSPFVSPSLNVSGAFPNILKHSNNSLVDKKPKEPMPPKPSREELAYIRQVLADVHPSSPSTFTMLHHALSTGSSSSSVSAQALLAKLGHLPGIEECLRMFTTVEILDGENMVGCHRCWKIANGTYKPKKRRSTQDEEVLEEESEEKDDAMLVSRPDSISSANAMDTEAVVSSTNVTSASTSLTDVSSASSVFSQDTVSITSTPTTVQSALPQPQTQLSVSDVSDKNSYCPPGLDVPVIATYGGLPIPSISTTAPETPSTAQHTPAVVDQPSKMVHTDPIHTNANGRLHPPTRRHKHFRKNDGVLDESSNSSDESGDDSASDASGDSSVYSDATSVASPSSPSASPHASVENIHHLVANTKPSSNNPYPASQPTKVPRSQQVIMRRAFKRYLVATPPPILVVHLKRFQQISKSLLPYAMPFSSGFKKLDDFVAFPEYLDLAPFLAPKREDFGLGHKGKEKKEKKKEKCMYRLYAVVVHIGDMLGGHYVAYTALPPSHAPPNCNSESEPLSAEDLTSMADSHRSKDSKSKLENVEDPTRQPRQWAYISDTIVRITTLEEVLKEKAYICMYERI